MQVARTSHSGGGARDLHRGHRGEQQQRLDLRLRQRQVVGDELPRPRGRGDDCDRGARRGQAAQAFTGGRLSFLPARPCSVARVTARRMSFMGSTDRTRGISSKLFDGGGEVVNHSNVLPFHGSGPALGPRLSEIRMLTTLMRTPMPRMNEPIVEIRFSAWRLPVSAYS